MVLVYSDTDSPRLRYTAGIIFTDVLGLDVKYTNSIEEYITSSHARINYSDTAMEGGIHIKPAEILFEQDIQNQTIKMGEWQGLPVFFLQDHVSPFPFDPFAMVFYLVSRYEEYIPAARDRHGRFIPEYSLAGEHGFLEKPLVDIIALKIRDQLKLVHPELEFIRRQYRFIPTVDIDQAFAHKGKGMLRSLGGLARSLFMLGFQDAVKKLKVIAHMQGDPFDNFDFQWSVFNKHKLKPLYFVLIGDYGPYDKNSSHRNKQFKDLLKKLAGYSDMGIHPSYGSLEDPGKMAVELERLSKIIDRPVHASRQHFLRTRFPDTYLNLVDLNVRHEYSMGYASRLGFRASTSTPYPAFNLARNRELPLRIYPFAFMDSTMSDYMHIKPQDYIKFVKPLISAVKQVGGTLTGVWHNYNLSDDKDRHRAFEEIIKAAANDQVSTA